MGERISFSAGLLLLLRNLLHQIIQAHGSALATEHFSLLEEHEGRDRLNAVLHGQCLVLIYIYFQDSDVIALMDFALSLLAGPNTTPTPTRAPQVPSIFPIPAAISFLVSILILFI